MKRKQSLEVDLLFFGSVTFGTETFGRQTFCQLAVKRERLVGQSTVDYQYNVFIC